MRYRSNLDCPNLRRQFKLANPPITIMGHEIPSDPDHDPNCGYWSDDEAAILYNVARQIKGGWCDLGSRFGWTAAHLLAAGVDDVWGVDPEYKREDFTTRALDNCPLLIPCPFTSAEFLKRMAYRGALFSGFVIDGDHDEPQPLRDALGCLRCAERDAMILFHDGRGAPILHAVTELVERYGFKAKAYWTPNVVFCCWRGNEKFVPPEHTPDPLIDWAGIRQSMAPYFDFGSIE